MEEKDYYELLEISRNASDEVIKNAYRALAKKYHPDTSAINSDLIEKKMRQINEAYEVLSNKEKRAIYDQELNERELALKQEIHITKDEEKIKNFNNANKNEKVKKEKNKKLIIIFVITFVLVVILSFIIASIIIEPSYFEKTQETVVENVDNQDNKKKDDNVKVDNNYNYEVEYDVNSYNEDEIVDSDIIEDTNDELTNESKDNEIEEEDNIIKIY